MKIFTLISALIISFNVYSQAWFPDSSAVWSVMDKKYFIKGDSIVNTIKYQKYFVSSDSIYDINSGTFFALLREDTTRKTYYIPKDSISEFLLYDFSLNTGDETTVYPSFELFSGAINVKATQVDSILLGTAYRKRIKIIGVDQNTNYDEYWIEGIGSTMGLFNSGLTGFVIFDITYPSLLCFENNGASVYDNPDFNSCYEIGGTSINDIQDEIQLSIYPNPFNHSIKLEGKGRYSFYVSDISGKALSTGNFVTTTTIDFYSYTKGVYLINITSESGHRSVRKIVKN